MNLISNILVAYDGSENSNQALDYAKELAQLNANSKVHILTAWMAPMGMASYEVNAHIRYDEILKSHEEDAKSKLAEAESRVAEIKERCQFNQVQGHPSTTIVNYAEENGIDLIVLGNRGLSGVKKLFLGSVSNRVVQDAPCAVLVIK